MQKIPDGCDNECMHYLSVMVAEASYRKREPLTYSSPEVLPSGTLVTVPFGRKSVAGIVVGRTTKPLFDTKPVNVIADNARLPASTLNLLDWLNEYYPSGGGSLASVFLPSGLAVQSRTKPDAYTKTSANVPPLTKKQEEVLELIGRSDNKSFLLHGETGSGKTRIYLERALHHVDKGKSVLILTPEISLVPQLAGSFGAVFGDRVVVIHSGLGKAKRNQHWLKVLNSEEPLVVIGTRSALFAPLSNVGLVVADEMHEPAYKQEQAPYYHGLRVAAQVSRIHNAEILYGSATPPVVEYYVAEKTGTPILRMAETAITAEKVEKSIVDLRDTSLFSVNRYLSDKLLGAIEKRLNNREQTLLFLNRRGTARLVLCQACGWQSMCPKCDMPLVYHGDKHRMRCHTCGFTKSPPLACPVCGSDDIAYRSMGTKALVETIQNRFPEAIIKRFDTDNTADEQLGRNFESVKSGQVDIIIGTQMLGKGLDLPKLSLVGIISAETSLGVPDFSSSERNYQLLHQAIGRVGRGHVHGEVIVQSFNPDNPMLRAALFQKWQDLYKQELEERKAYGFPPFVFLLKLTISRKTPVSAEKYAKQLLSAIAGMRLPVTASEPTPAFYERQNGKYNWQIVVKSRRRGHLVGIVNNLPKGDYTYDLDPINLL